MKSILLENNLKEKFKNKDIKIRAYRYRQFKSILHT